MNTTIPVQIFKVKRSTADMFFTLFAKAGARGTVAWLAFEAATADSGFSVTPGRVGLAYAFSPLDTMGLHQSSTTTGPILARLRVGGYWALRGDQNDKYGWTERTFVVE